MGFVNRRNVIKKRTDRSLESNKANLEGIIIYVNDEFTWANVKLNDSVTLYRIPFAEGINPRLKRLEQTVLLTQSVDKRYKYTITSPSRRKLAVSDFEYRGSLYWSPNSNGSVWATPVAKWQWA